MRRTSFAAPLLITFVTALPGCPKSSGGRTTTTVDNKDPNPQPEVPQGEPSSRWVVTYWDGACEAQYPDDCPPDAKCNPPPPMKVQCPPGVTEDHNGEIVQYEEDGPCYSGGEVTPCPSWE